MPFHVRRFLTFGALSPLLLSGCLSEILWWRDSGREPAAADSGDAAVQVGDAGTSTNGAPVDAASTPGNAAAAASLPAIDDAAPLGNDAPLTGDDPAAVPQGDTAVLRDDGAVPGSDVAVPADLAAANGPFATPTPLVEPARWADDEDRRAWVRETLASLSLRQKVAQMLMPSVSGAFMPEGSEAYERALSLVEVAEVGGFIVSSGTPLDVAAKLNLLQRRSHLPLLVAADLETGAGFRMRGAAYLPAGTDLGGATDFPSLMALGAAGDRFLAYETGRVTAEEARAVGIHVPFAPVLDVNNNPNNPVINTRSFGEDPLLVAMLGACLVRGIQDYGGVATGKHFPGHGNTSTDSHVSLPVVQLGRDEIEATELLPFREAVAAGVGAIMTAHISMPKVTGDPLLPATLSSGVVTGLLREDMGFQGLVFTDAMDMEAIDNFFPREEAAVLAVEAGVDVLVMPPEPEAAVRGIMSAVFSGRISEERIDESVTRILELKAELGLHRARTVDLESVLGRVGILEHTEIAQRVADRSLTVLRNGGDLLPLAGTRTADVLSVTYRRTSDLLVGRTLDTRLTETYPGLQSATLGPDSPDDEYDRLLQRVRRMDLVVVSLHIGVAAAGTVAAPPELVEFLQGLSQSGRPHVVISFGNPYLLSDFPEVQTYVLAWSGAEVSELAVARALLGELPIQGRTPTRIPPEFGIGDGIQILARGGGVELPMGGTCG